MGGEEVLLTLGAIRRELLGIAAARIRRLEVDELTVGRLSIREDDRR